MMDKFEAAKKYFGYDSFRKGQAEIIDALTSGHDAFAVMPTGAGKSICYQIPALILPGVTLVISPLISLMKDQVAALTQAGVRAAFVNSSLTQGQYSTVLRRAANGEYRIIYVAPERLESADFLRFARELDISLVAVDEAHCVSQWGQDFRPSYLKIVKFTASLDKRPVMGAFTATATAEVREDVVRMLALDSPIIVSTGFDRPNLRFDVATPQSKERYLFELVRRFDERSGIVYCSTRKHVERVCEKLNAAGIAATRYHAGLDDAERRKNQDDFVYDRARVMVATNAFGMGIDKSNVGFVVHYNMPKNIESYYQEAGRAGRDGSPADCVLMFSKGDVSTARMLIESGDDNAELTDEERETVYRRDMERLERMTGYCQTKECLRRYILSYFGEEAPTRCGNCGNCEGEYDERDITTEAQKILSCIVRIRKACGFGVGAVLCRDVLRAGRGERITKLGLDRLSTYGIMKDADARTVGDYIDELIAQGYIEKQSGEMPVLCVTEKGSRVLFSGERVTMRIKRDDVEAAARMKPQKETRKPRERTRGGMQLEAASPDEALFEALRTLRASIAQELSVPAYIVFSNATLYDMAAKKPRTMEEFMRVTGVGAVKAERFGEKFVNEIIRYLGEM